MIFRTDSFSMQDLESSLRVLDDDRLSLCKKLSGHDQATLPFKMFCQLLSIIFSLRAITCYHSFHPQRSRPRLRP